MWYNSNVKAKIVFAGICVALAAAQAEVMRPGVAHDVRKRVHVGVPSVAVSSVNGRLWATWYTSTTPGEDLNSYAILATSADGGATWREALIADPDGPGPERPFDPQLWVAPDGRLRWTWTERLCDPKKGDVNKRYGGDEGDPRTDRLTMATLSAEDEPTLPVETRVVARGVMMGKPLVLKDGTWLFPSAHWNEAPSACLYASTDGGRTFALRGGATLPVAARLYDEHEIVPRADGSLLCFIRGNWGKGHHPWETVSRDAGRTWSEPVKARFANTSGRIFFRKLASGNCLLVKNGPFDADVGRTQIMAFLSRDDGETWSKGFLLDDRANVAYPDGDQFADGRIVVVYDRDRFGAREILFATFTEADVLAGRDVSGKVRLRGIVSRH